MAQKLRHLVESQQLNAPLLRSLFGRANHFQNNPSHDSPEQLLRGKIVATLFYEPSTRTRLSFESAAQKLGAKILSTENAKDFSSAAKDESLEDTVRVIGGYSNCIVLRHSEVGAAKRAAKVSKVPIINAGDGKGQHPTQALTDIYTIAREMGRIDGIKIGFVGDLAMGRTVRSLCYLLAKFESVDMTFIAPSNLRIGEDIRRYLKRHSVRFRENGRLHEVLPKLDVLYVTRLQKERMSKVDYEKARGKYVIDRKALSIIKDHARIMHPLPHVEEINLPIEVEERDQRIAYFRQAENGLYIRMALLHNILG